MNSKNAKKEDSTLLTEMISLTGEETDAASAKNDPKSKKVQAKFDEAFKDLSFEDGGELDFLAHDSSEDSSKNNAKKESEHNDIAIDFEVPSLDLDTTGSSSISVSDKTKQTESISTHDSNDGGFEMDFSDGDNDLSAGGFDEGTKKTIIINKSDLDFSSLDEPISEAISSESHEMFNDGMNEFESFDIGEDNIIIEASGSEELISSEAAKHNIEATINNIIRPKEAAGTEEFTLDSFQEKSSVTGNTDLLAEEYQEAENDKTEEGFDIDFGSNPKTDPSYRAKNQIETNSDDELFDNLIINQAVVAENLEKNPPVNTSKLNMQSTLTSSPSMARSDVSSDEYINMQSTIRQLREERESFIQNIKSLKSEVREYEQDNLTLKAIVDETKIEVNILRKRNLVELEDAKYRLLMSEEKRLILEEKNKHLEKIKEKFEQKARIDINQVRQREKELESKLEMMSLDVDSQVHSRDQKILELRRKIDSLEFNMENVSIKEQKSTDDKRKLEDKLNKIMKTLRNSIKNLEDDIELSTDSSQNSEKSK